MLIALMILISFLLLKWPWDRGKEKNRQPKTRQIESLPIDGRKLGPEFFQIVPAWFNETNGFVHKVRYLHSRFRYEIPIICWKIKFDHWHTPKHIIISFISITSNGKNPQLLRILPWIYECKGVINMIG